MCLNPQFPADLVTFTEELVNGKLQFFCSGPLPDKRNQFKVCLKSELQ